MSLFLRNVFFSLRKTSFESQSSKRIGIDSFSLFDYVALYTACLHKTYEREDQKSCEINSDNR